MNQTLNGGKGRRYFFKEPGLGAGPRVDVLNHPEFSYDDNNFELLDNLISDEVFGRPQIPRFTKMIEGGYHLRDLVSEVEGTVHYRDGSKYTGEIRISERCGKGTMLYSNGEKYSGEWFGGLKHGQGVYHWLNGDSREGTWILNKMEDRGTLHLSSGDSYTGIWRAGNLIEGHYQELSLVL